MVSHEVLQIDLSFHNVVENIKGVVGGNLVGVQLFEIGSGEVDFMSGSTGG